MGLIFQFIINLECRRDSLALLDNIRICGKVGESLGNVNHIPRILKRKESYDGKEETCQRYMDQG